MKRTTGGVVLISGLVVLALIAVLWSAVHSGTIGVTQATPGLVVLGGMLGAIWSTWQAYLMEAAREDRGAEKQLKEIAYEVYWELVAGMNLAHHYSSENFKQLVRLPNHACQGVLRSGIGIPRQLGAELVRYLEKVAVMNSEIEIFLSGVTVTGPTVTQAEVDLVRRGVLNELKKLSDQQLFPQAQITVKALKSAGLIPMDYKENYEAESKPQPTGKS